MKRAQQGLEELRKHVDTIIVIPNQNLFKIANEKTTYKESFQLSNSVLRHGVQSVTDLMVKDGLVNLDFADVETVMSSMGKAMMGTGEADGEGRADKATDMALNNPLIDDYTLRGAKGLLINITGGEDLTLFEVDQIVNKVRAEVDSDAEIINGSIIDPNLEGKIRVSIVATALDGQQPESKSVINMVHRIQNRNPGYSDFSHLGSSQSFNFSKTMSSPITEGATALKLENEVEEQSLVETSDFPEQDSSDLSSATSEEVDHQEGDNEIKFSENDNTDSNGLENFGIEQQEEEPGLFNSENNENSEDEFTSFKNTENSEEDELEIPAFLRRQKN